MSNFSSIASKAIPVFRTVWNVAKSSGAINSLKDIVVGRSIVKNIEDVNKNVKKN